MTPFEHLSVLISIVLGLGLTHLLSSAHKLVQARPRVRVYWLPLLWTAIVFVAQIEWWWAIFEFREHTDWNFFYFLFLLLSPVALFLASAFVLPDVEPGGSYDLEQYYYGTRRWFFPVLASVNLFDGIRRGIEAGSFVSFGAYTNFIAVVTIVSLAFTTRRIHHAVVSVGVAGMFLFFILAAALRIGA